LPKKIRKHPELSALKGRIREEKTSYRKLAEHISMGTNTLSDKINGFYAFSGPEIELITEFLNIAPNDVVKYFFPTMLRNSA